MPAGDGPQIQACRADWSADGKYLAAGYGLERAASHKNTNSAVPARTRLFRPGTWALEREWAAHKVRVCALEFSPCGTALASGGQQEVALWDPAGGRKVMAFPPHGDEVTAARWSADGKLLVTGAGSERHDSAGSGGGGKCLAPGKDRLVRIWRVAD